MKTHEQAREKARDLAAKLAHDSAHIPAIESIVLSAILDAQREAVKEARPLIATGIYYANLVQFGFPNRRWDRDNYVTEAQQFLTTYEQRNDEGRTE